MLARALKVSVEELAALLGDAEAGPSEALCIPVPVEVLWPELHNGQPPESPHLRPWPAARTLKELSIFVRSDMLTRRETLTRAVKALSAPALVAPIAGWIDTPPGRLEPREHGTQRIGVSDVEAIERSTRFFAATDAEVGGALSREAAVGQLKYAVDLARDASYTEVTGNRLLAVIAELSGLVGWMCMDSGMRGPAQRYFTYGLQAARESTDPRARLLVVSILSDMAQQMRWLDRPQAALRLHDLAASQVPADTRRFNVVRAVLMGNRVVDGLCYLGPSHHAEARSALKKSFDLYSRADAEDRADAPTMWHRVVASEARLSSNAGEAHLVLARENKRLAAEAEKFHLLSVANMGRRQGRNRVFYLIGLARTRFLANEPLQGADDGERALEAAEAVSSAMIRTRLRVLMADSKPYSALPHVAQFRDLLRGTIARWLKAG
jgi:hypothetical protein